MVALLPSLRRPSPGVLVALLVGLLAALCCAGAASAAVPKTCSIATQAEVKAAFGGTVSKGDAGDASPTDCQFRLSGGNLGVSGSIILRSVSFGGPAKTAITSFTRAHAHPIMITGLGAGGYGFYVNERLDTSAIVLKNTTGIEVQSLFFGLPTSSNARLQADVIALSRLAARHI